MAAANPDKRDAGSSTFASAFARSQSDATSAQEAASAFSFGAPGANPGSSAPEGGGFAFGGSGGVFSAASAADPSGSNSNADDSTSSATGSNFGASGSRSTGQSPFTLGVAPTRATGTSLPGYSVYSEKDPSNPSAILQYHSISAAPAYRDMSFEELRVQDYQQHRKRAGASGRMTDEALSAQISSILNTSRFNFNSGTSSVFKSRNAFGLPSHTSDPSKLICMEELLRKLFLGEELVDTQFYLFSARSSSTDRVTRPRVLCANNALLVKASKYFSDLLSSDTKTCDPSTVDLMGNDDVPSSAQFDDYGYESDSDLEDCGNPIPEENPGDQLATSSTPASKGKGKARAVDDNDSIPITDSSSAESSRSVIQSSVGNQVVTHTRLLGRRHILVKDTAFQTWYTLLNYLCTGKFGFLPLSSAASGRNHESSTGHLDVPRCSAKSMYRLASKVGLDELRDEAFSYIRSNLSEQNIVRELSCGFVSKYPRLLEMELNILYARIGSPPVVANFDVLARRIANGELPHGAAIILGIHKRLLTERNPFSLKPFWASQKSVRPDAGGGDVPKGEVGDEARPSHAGGYPDGFSFANLGSTPGAAPGAYNKSDCHVN